MGWLPLNGCLIATTGLPEWSSDDCGAGFGGVAVGVGELDAGSADGFGGVAVEASRIRAAINCQVNSAG